MKDRVRMLFLLDTETFEFWVEGGFVGSFPGGGKLLDPLVWETLNGEHQPPGTWKHELYGMRENVMKVLRTGHRVTITENTWLLEFTSGCPLWNERVLLGAPSVC